MTQAEKLIANADYAAAVKLFDQQLTEDPSDTQTLLRKGNALSKSGQAWEAVTAFETAFQLGDPTPELPAALSQLWTRIGNSQLALRYAEKAVAASPRSVSARLAYAELLADSGAVDQAMAQLDALRSSRPPALTNAEFAHARAQIFTRGRKFSFALKALRRARRLGVQAPVLSRYLASQLFELGRYEESVEVFEHALLHQPDQQLQRALIVALVRCQRGETARQELRLYRLRYPSDPSSETLSREIDRLE